LSLDRIEPLTTPISLVILGTGFSQSQHVPALQKLKSEFRVVGVFGRTEDKVRAITRQLPGDPVVFTDLDRALGYDGLEAVDIALPILPAADTVEAAFDHGVHVFSEKPIAGSVERAWELLARHALHPDRVWCVAENFRFWPTAQLARDLIESGEIGTPLICHYPTLLPIKGTPFFESEWRRRPEYAGGFLLDGGVHDIAALRVMFGDVAEVSAVVRSIDSALPPADTLAATLRFESGVVASYTASYALDPMRITKTAAIRALVRGGVRAIRDRFGRKHIVGTRGSLFFLRDRVELVRGLRRTVFKAPKRDVMVDELLDFRGAVRERRPLHNTPEEALNDLATIEAILKASEERAVIRLDEVPISTPPHPVSSPSS
jgi:predicted dehydrogenase